METLQILTYLAGALLCLYLLIFVVIVGAVGFLLGWGLGWGNRKLDWVFDKANTVLATVERYTTQGMDLAAQPELRATAAGNAAETFVRRLFGRRRGP